MDTDEHRWTRDLSVLDSIELRYKLNDPPLLMTDGRVRVCLRHALRIRLFSKGCVQDIDMKTVLLLTPEFCCKYDDCNQQYQERGTFLHL